MASATKLPAFVVDKKGLAKLLERKGKSFAVVELVQNAWDEDTSRVDVMLERVRPDDDLYMLTVEDDNPEGFKDLTHAYTLFADSAKKADATKRGRFNLGEKLVIALCEKATIQTTKGTVIFDGDHRVHSAKKRAAGSMFSGWLRLTEKDVAEVAKVVNSLLPPHGIETTFNLAEIQSRTPVCSFEVTLPTEIADDSGVLRRTTRKTTVEAYEPLPNERASIYEMGIPVVDTGDRFHVNVMQKVPLPTDRDNVPPAYLRDLRVAVLNACAGLLSEADAKQAWVTNALEDDAADPEVVKAIFAKRFGEKTVIFDPNDPEANARAAAEGYTVVPGGSLPKAAWTQVKASGAVLPAGQVTPSPSSLLNKGAAELKTMDPAHWPDYIRRVAEFAQSLAEKLMSVEGLEVQVVNDAKFAANMTWERRDATSARLTMNVGRLGHAFFQEPGVRLLDLLLDEFGHQYASNHLSEDYYRALRTLGAKMTMLALSEPETFALVGPAVAVA